MAAHHVHDDHAHPDIDQRVTAALDLLRADGGRITAGRRAIVHSLMAASDHHVTAEHIATIVQAEHPEIHLSTVYRTLDSLERLGAVVRVNLGPGGAIYHPSDHEHHHFVCESCGAVHEIDEDLVAPALDKIERRHDFTLKHFTISGLCARCR